MLETWGGRALVLLVFTLAVSACATVTIDEEGRGELSGRVLVEWYEEDRFIYRATGNPITFKPSFFKDGDGAIVPQDMFTDGGSVPRVFWSVPGLSPWALGPAYIIHDWLFAVRRCGFDAPPAVRAIDFRQSAQVLAEVATALVEAGLIRNDRRDEIVWAVSTRYARELWERPPQAGECQTPPAREALSARARGQSRIVADFIIPPPRRR